MPASIVISSAMSALCSPISAPNRLTSAPRTGAGTTRQAPNADLAAAIEATISALPAAGTSNRSSPVIGERAITVGPGSSTGSAPQRSRLRRARALSSSAEETDSELVLIGPGTTLATSSAAA